VVKRVLYVLERRRNVDVGGQAFGASGMRDRGLGAQGDVDLEERRVIGVSAGDAAPQRGRQQCVGGQAGEQAVGVDGGDDDGRGQDLAVHLNPLDASACGIQDDAIGARRQAHLATLRLDRASQRIHQSTHPTFRASHPVLMAHRELGGGQGRRRLFRGLPA
jgi:hypothetical protein